jgi:N-methylhydantoinase B
MSTTETTDPILLEVIRNQLDGIADEMEVALVRSAYSSIVKEGHDASTGLFDAHGEMLAQSTSLPAQLGVMTPAVGAILDRFDRTSMVEGDVFILNDPYSGGTHLPDIAIVVPVLVDGTVAGFAASIAHHMDVGGKTPGSSATDSVEIYQEGFRMPPLRLYRAGEPDEALHALLTLNTRLPEMLFGDIRAQLAAAHVGRTRLLTLFGRHGTDVLLRAFDELLARGEAIARARIAAIPDGSYSFVDHLDNDGLDLDRLISIAVTVTVEGSDLVVDFEGSSPQVRGPFNADTSATLSAVYFVVRAIAGGDAPRNGGVYRPLRVVLPEGTVVNPRAPAPVTSRTMTMKRIVDTLLGALVHALPGEIPAAPCGLERIFIYSGINPQTGQRFVCADLDTGGSGGGALRDGVDVIRTDIANVTNVPAEALELSYPLRVHRNALWPDSCGAGRHRGGLGSIKEMEILHGPVTMVIKEDRHRTRPWGLFGGLPAEHSHAEIHRVDGAVEEIPTNGVYVLETGDRVVCEGCSGGAGYGDPFDREPALVLEDVLDRKISSARARSDYGVVLSEGGGSVDESETGSLRTGLRAERGPVTWTYDRGEHGRQ